MPLLQVHSQDASVRLRFGAVNTNPMVTKYAKANYKYNTSEWRAYVSSGGLALRLSSLRPHSITSPSPPPLQASPANITDQLNFLETALNTSKATWDVSEDRGKGRPLSIHLGSE